MKTFFKVTIVTGGIKWVKCPHLATPLKKKKTAYAG